MAIWQPVPDELGDNSLCEVLRSCVDLKQPPFLQRPVILFDLAVGLGLVETREDARDPTATSDTLTVCAPAGAQISYCGARRAISAIIPISGV